MLRRSIPWVPPVLIYKFLQAHFFFSVADDCCFFLTGCVTTFLSYEFFFTVGFLGNLFVGHSTLRMGLSLDFYHSILTDSDFQLQYSRIQAIQASTWHDTNIIPPSCTIRSVHPSSMLLSMNSLTLLLSICNPRPRVFLQF